VINAAAESSASQEYLWDLLAFAWIVYRPLQSGPRSEREVAFYSALFTPPSEGLPALHAAYPAPLADEANHVVEQSKDGQGPNQEDVIGLQEFVPTFCKYRYDTVVICWI